MSDTTTEPQHPAVVALSTRSTKGLSHDTQGDRPHRGCLGRIADELSNIPNFDRTEFLVACGVYPALQRGGLSDVKKQTPRDIPSPRPNGSGSPSNRPRNDLPVG
jgi:hypothetical protein